MRATTSPDELYAMNDTQFGSPIAAVNALDGISAANTRLPSSACFYTTRMPFTKHETVVAVEPPTVKLTWSGCRV